MIFIPDTTMFTKHQLMQAFAEHKQEIQAYGVHRLGLFGSYLHNLQTEASDIDLLVEFEPQQKSYDNFIHLSFYLESLFQKKVDLITPSGLSPYLKNDILRDIEYLEIT